MTRIDGAVAANTPEFYDIFHFCNIIVAKIFLS